MKVSIKKPEPPKDFCTIILTESETKMLAAMIGRTIPNETSIGKFAYKFYNDVLETAFNGDYSHIKSQSDCITTTMKFKE